MSGEPGTVFDDRFYQFARNGRWGTCATCPRNAEGHIYPEFCEHTERSDHTLTLSQLVDLREREEDNHG